MDKKRVASMLEIAMCNGGYFDDYDEVIQDAFDDSPETADDLHADLVEGLKFINKHLGRNYDIKRWNINRQNCR